MDSSVDFVDYVMCIAYGRRFGEAIALSNLDLDGVCGLAFSGDAIRDFSPYFFMDSFAEDRPNELWDLPLSHACP